MGPTNVALVKLYQADQRLREAQARLDAVARNAKLQQRRVGELSEKLRAGQERLKQQQSQTAQLDLDLKSREGRIERLRGQQQNAKTNREYQAFLVEINTEKVDKGKVEEQLLKGMEANETLQGELSEQTTLLESERAKGAQIETEIGGQVGELTKEIESLRPQRETAAAAVPVRARDAFDRLADRLDGEAMSAITKPDRRREAYACSACNMDLVTDVYNKLHSRDELVFCPSCHRILYIPDDLPLDLAVNKPKERKEPKAKAGKAAIGRQLAAEDVMRSVTVEEDGEPAPASPEIPESQQNQQAPQEQSTQS